jgi:site-specific recombinase XerD
MASIYQKGKGWWMNIPARESVSGRKRQVSLPAARTEGEALRLLERVREKIDEQATVVSLVEIFDWVGIQTKGMVPLGETEEYMQRECVEKGNETTIRARRAALRRFLKWMSRHRPYAKWLQAVGKDDAMAYWKAMEKKGLAANTRDHNLSYLRTCWDYLRHPADLRENIWHGIDWLNEDGESYLPFTIVQVRELIEKGDQIDSIFEPGFWPGVIRVAYYTGLRESDVMVLNESQIKHDQGYIRIVPGKTARYKIQSIHPLDAPWLQQLPEPDENGYYWPVAARMIHKGRTNEYRAFRGEWQQLLGLIGLEATRAPKHGEKRVRDVSLYTFHSLRHTCVTAARDNGADPRDVQTVVGHSNVTMTDHYDHSDAWVREDLEAARRVYQALPRV